MGLMAKHGAKRAAGGPTAPQGIVGRQECRAWGGEGGGHWEGSAVPPAVLMLHWQLVPQLIHAMKGNNCMQSRASL